MHRRLDSEFGNDGVGFQNMLDLAGDLRVGARVRLDLDVVHGVVTLDGTVEWNYQKVAAAGAVLGVHGALNVVDLIMVKPRALPPIVKDVIEAALKRNADLDAKNIHVAIKNGTVELTGKVHSISEREDAERAAWDAPGVVSVENHLWVTC